MGAQKFGQLVEEERLTRGQAPGRPVRTFHRADPGFTFTRISS